MSYRIGADFERKCKRSLEEKGWRVWRMAGSHSESDLIAHRGGSGDRWRDSNYSPPNRWALIQCKKNGKLYGKERMHFKDVAEECGATAMLAKAGKNGGGIEWVVL